ncbi:MAG: fibrobacter succinogenes major paralogous domain-containing protein [Bacteroidales bacterium]
MKKASFIIFLLLGFGYLAHAQTNYPSVTIGDQIWMKENLNVDKFRNGDPIPHVKNYNEWTAARKNKQPAWCYYNNRPAKGEKYGKLYNWYAVNDPRGLAPEGWKIPSDEDWSRLTDFLGGAHFAGKKMKFTDFWADNDGESGNGTNASDFSGLPGGERSYLGPFDKIGNLGRWWSSTEDNAQYAWYRHLVNSTGILYRGTGFKPSGYSVRCLRD